MTNKLFIGPYSYPNYIGTLSNLYLEHILSLDSSQSFASRRCFLHNDKQTIRNSETRLLDTYDVLIQNLSLEQIAVNYKFKKNIVIPNLTGNIKISNAKYAEQLQLADLILVNNSIDYQKILSLNIAPSKIQQFSIPISINAETTSKKLQLGIYDSYFKFYFIGEYASNQDIVKSLIVSFCDTFKNQECFLILWLVCTPAQRTEILDFYQQIKLSLNMTNTLDNILFICRPVDYNEIPALHNTGDVYLAVNSDYYPFIDEQIAAGFGKYIINREQLNSSYAPILTQGRNGEYVSAISIDSLSNKMWDKFSNKNSRTQPLNKKNKKRPTLYSLI